MTPSSPPRSGSATDLDPRKVTNEITGGGSEGDGRRSGRADPLLGKIIAEKYRVLDLVAQGGMGRIYRAEQLPLGRIVALKILRPRQAFETKDDTFQKRFTLEAATCARLTHPNTVTLFDYGQITLGNRTTFFMVFEFVQGRTLSDVLKADGPFPPARALRVAGEICRSLQEAHQAGIVHRDLKPSNVMLLRRDDGESVKVLDFGVAKVLEDDQENITKADSVVGSPRYMSPEQIRHLDLDGRSDIYALGVLLYLMLSGQVPFAKEGAVGTLMAHLTEPVPSIQERSERGVPPQVEAVVRRCLEKNPKDRYPNAIALREALEAVLGTLPEDDTPLDDGPVTPVMSVDDTSQTTLKTGDLPPPIGATPRTPQPTQTGPNRGPAIAVGAVLLLILGAVGYALTRPKDEPVATPPAVAAKPAAVVIPVLSLDSAPSGASVLEDGKLLGTTPLDIPMEGPAQRTFEVQLKGYKSATLTQPPITANATARVELVAAPSVKPPVQNTTVRKPPQSGNSGSGSNGGSRNDGFINER